VLFIFKNSWFQSGLWNWSPEPESQNYEWWSWSLKFEFPFNKHILYSKPIVQIMKWFLVV